MAVTLGVDVGTTAVKCALVDATTRALLASAYETTGEYVGCGAGRAEQSVDAILRAVHVALAKLPQETLRVISSVGICGQVLPVPLHAPDPLYSAG
jgi:sugar (pentulose or hexulose) kinase